MQEFHALHPTVALALNVTRKPFSFLGQQPEDEDNGRSEKWGGFPRLKREGIWHDRLTDYSGSSAGRDDFEANMRRLGEAAGVAFDFNVYINRQPIDSQRMLLWAGRFGKGERFMSALSDRHFQRGSQGESASKRPTLLAAAQEAGLDVGAAAAFLETDELRDEVWRSYGEMPRKGITGSIHSRARTQQCPRLHPSFCCMLIRALIVCCLSRGTSSPSLLFLHPRGRAVERAVPRRQRRGDGQRLRL